MIKLYYGCKIYIIYLNIYHRLEEIKPFVTCIKSYTYTSSTGRNYAVSSWHFTPLINGLKSYSMNTDADSGVKSYSL